MQKWQEKKQEVEMVMISLVHLRQHEDSVRWCSRWREKKIKWKFWKKIVVEQNAHIIKSNIFFSLLFLFPIFFSFFLFIIFHLCVTEKKKTGSWHGLTCRDNDLKMILHNLVSRFSVYLFCDVAAFTKS